MIYTLNYYYADEDDLGPPVFSERVDPDYIFFVELELAILANMEKINVVHEIRAGNGMVVSTDSDLMRLFSEYGDVDVISLFVKGEVVHPLNMTMTGVKAGREKLQARRAPDLVEVEEGQMGIDEGLHLEVSNGRERGAEEAVNKEGVGGQGEDGRGEVSEDGMQEEGVNEAVKDRVDSSRDDGMQEEGVVWQRVSDGGKDSEHGGEHGGHSEITTKPQEVAVVGLKQITVSKVSMSLAPETANACRAMEDYGFCQTKPDASLDQDVESKKKIASQTQLQHGEAAICYKRRKRSSLVDKHHLCNIINNPWTLLLRDERVGTLGDIAIRANTSELPRIILPVETDGQRLPFAKVSQIWKQIESMKTFHMFPQNPHFRPLELFQEFAREGIAIGCMIMFDNMVQEWSKLVVDDERSKFDCLVNGLLYLETHGFNVDTIRSCVTKLQEIRDEREHLQLKLEEVEGEVTERTVIKAKTDADLESAVEELKRLEEKVAGLVSAEGEGRTNVAALKSRAGVIDRSISENTIQFGELVAAFRSASVPDSSI